MRIVLLALSLFLAVPAAGQSVSRLPASVGDEVRLRGPLRRDGLTRAVIREFGPTYLQFTVEEYPGVVFVRSYKNLDLIEVPRLSRKDGARSAGLWGLYLAGAAGAIAGPFMANALSLETGTAIGVVGAGAGLVGGLVGAAAGAVLNPVRWDDYQLR